MRLEGNYPHLHTGIILPFRVRGEERKGGQRKGSRQKGQKWRVVGREKRGRSKMEKLGHERGIETMEKNYPLAEAKGGRDKERKQHKNREEWGRERGMARKGDGKQEYGEKIVKR